MFSNFGVMFSFETWFDFQGSVSSPDQLNQIFLFYKQEEWLGACCSAYLYIRTLKGHGTWTYHIIEGEYNLQSKDIWLVLLYLRFFLNAFY